MKVIDAGVVVNLLVGRLAPELLSGAEMAVPHLLDTEVMQVLRRLVRHRVLTEVQGARAVEAFLDLHLVRWPADGLRPRIWRLQDNLSAYDATYVALAEILDAPLVTTDSRLARAPGPTCLIEQV